MLGVLIFGQHGIRDWTWFWVMMYEYHGGIGDDSCVKWKGLTGALLICLIVCVGCFHAALRSLCNPLRILFRELFVHGADIPNYSVLDNNRYKNPNSCIHTHTQTLSLSLSRARAHSAMGQEYPIGERKASQKKRTRLQPSSNASQKQSTPT